MVDRTHEITRLCNSYNIREKTVHTCASITNVVTTNLRNGADIRYDIGRVKALRTLRQHAFWINEPLIEGRWLFFIAAYLALQFQKIRKAPSKHGYLRVKSTPIKRRIHEEK